MHLNMRLFKDHVTAINDQVNWDLDRHFVTETLKSFSKAGHKVMLQNFMEFSHIHMGISLFTSSSCATT